MKHKVLEEHNEWMKNNKDRDVLNKEKYETFISNCGDLIESLERTLVEQMSLERNRYVRVRAERRIERFREELPSKEDSSENKWKLLWKH